MIPPLLANMNLNRSPATVTGRSQDIMVTPRKKEQPGNFLLNSSASPKPMINWKNMEPTVKIKVFMIALERMEFFPVNSSA